MAERQQLESLTVKQLREEAQNLNLPTERRRRRRRRRSRKKKELIDILLSHHERNAFFPSFSRQDVPDADVRSERAQDGPEESPVECEIAENRPDETQGGQLQQFMKTVTDLLQQQQQMFLQLQQIVLQFNQTAQTVQVPAMTSEVIGNGQNTANSPGREYRSVHSEPSTGDTGGRTRSAVSMVANAVNLLALQIPEYGGSEEENVRLWIQRVDRVAQIHKAPDDVTMLAATRKLTNIARKWINMGTGPMLDSWSGLKEAMLKRFDRKILFSVAMQWIEARKWYPAKETFEVYATDKISLMFQLDLPIRDQIHLLINGITSRSLKGTASAIRVDTMDEFLEEMHRITAATAEPVKKSQFVAKAESHKEIQCGKCGRKGHTTKACKTGTLTCLLCKAPGHHAADCPKSNRKEAMKGQSQRAAETVEAAAATAPQEDEEVVASVLTKQRHERILNPSADTSNNMATYHVT